MINDTSDAMLSSDQGNLLDEDDDYVQLHKGSVQMKEGDLDPYQKIKMHANLSLRYIFRHSNKIVT